MSESKAASDVELLKARIELMELEAKKQAAEAAQKAPAAKPWWTTLVEVLALPAAVIAIVFQLTQTSGNISTQEKTQAETAKIKVETSKTQIELQKAIDELAAAKNKGVAEYRQEIERALPQLEATIQKLRSLDAQASRNIFEFGILKYVLLWILMTAVGLVFDVVQASWSLLITNGMMFVSGIQLNDKQGEPDYDRTAKVKRRINWLLSSMVVLPQLFRWSIQLSIFVALIIPLFNEFSGALGSNISFDTIVTQAKRFELTAVLDTMRTILFPNSLPQ